jgi:outer membrane protein OmpU
MKKVLLTGAALVAVATSPAMAEGLKLDLAGHAKVYGVYTDADTDNTHELNIRKETEIHFTGETTLDSGLTVGAHVEMNVDANDGDVEESYIYMSGGWGRVNVGEEDGVAYLLQVSAPSADSNVDGLRQYISAGDAAVSGRLDYDQATSGTANKLSYMTPVFNGFQGGISYVPTVADAANGTTSVATDNTAGLSDGYELAARYEGAYEGVGVAFGAGYGSYDGEITTADRDAWNAGLDLDFSGFGFGVAYLEEEQNAAGDDREVLVVGADYQMGAYKLGASWLNQDGDNAVVNELDRITAGASYSYGPGMSFRGSVSLTDNDTANTDETQFLVGTQINF